MDTQNKKIIKAAEKASEKAAASAAKAAEKAAASAAKAAEKGLSLVSGLCWRYHPGKRGV